MALTESPRSAVRRVDGSKLPPGDAARGWLAWALTGPALALAAWSAWSLPSLGALVSGVLMVAAALVWRWPVLALALVPAALPVFDLAPWTGRFYWDEFDLLLFVVLAIGWHRTTPPRAGTGRGPVLVPALFGISLAISVLRGLMPWQWPDLNSFVSYNSGFNALRIAKGAIWAAGFIALYRRLKAPGADKHRVFALGMCGGLLMTVCVVVWERLAFADLFDFQADYRVTGPFSAMHTGGAYVECYLAIATAWLLWLVLQPARPLWRWLGLLLLLFATYATMVTYSRNGYAALLVAALVVLGAAIARPKGLKRPRVVALVVVGLMTAVAAPVLLGPYAGQRLASIGRDQSIRWAHWQDALRMRDDDWPTEVFGVGLGSFPAMHYWRSAEPVHAAAYDLGSDATGTFLRLGRGAPVYIEQWVDVQAGQRYRLSLDVRSAGSATLGVALCQKWMLTSGSCDGATIDASAAPPGWHRVSVSLSTERWAPRAWYRERPVKLAIYSAGGASTIDVDNVHLDTEAGSPLLANSDFSAGLDHWFFSTDVDPPWHIHSMPVTILFEQGWLGALAWSAAIGLAVGTATKRVWRGDSLAAPVLAALLAMLVSGLLNTLIDAPRFFWLAAVLMWLASVRDDPIRAGSLQ